MPNIKCVKVSPDLYLGVTTLDALRSNCMNPMEVAKSTEKQRSNNAALRDAWRHRGDLQRQFGKARTQRAVDYAHYINDVVTGKRTGGYPPITLWTDKKGDYNSATGMLSIVGAAVITASDGETQLAARYMLAYGFDGDGFHRPIVGDRAWLDVPFAISISTSSSKEDAMQTLHDLNTYSTPIKETETAPLNTAGVLTKAVNAGIEASNIQRSLIKNKGKVTVNSAQPTSMLALLHGAIAVVNDVDVLTRSSPPSWLAEGNKPYATARGRETLVAQFVTDLLNGLPSATLRTIDLGHMMALGVYYAHNQVIHPITLGEVEAAVDAVRVANGRNRVTVRRAAEAIHDAMQRNPVVKAA